MADSISRILLREAALKRGLQISYVGKNEHFMKIAHPDGRWELMRGTLTSRSGALGAILSRHKYLTSEFIESLGINTPPMMVYVDEQKAIDFLSLYKRIVVKPADAMQSRGVTTNVTSENQLKEAVNHARKYSKNNEVLLQKQLEGKLYRLLVVNNKMVAAAHRKAAEVEGDGNSTIEQLIIRLNQDPQRSDGTHTHLKKVDKVAAEKYLGSEKYKSILKKGEIVQISPLDSISAGGTAANVTDIVNPKISKLVETITADLRLFICGYDIICDDISVAHESGYLPLIESNSMPGLKLHHFPTAGGEPIDAAGIIIDELFKKQ